MWNFVVLTIMIGVAGYYSMTDQKHLVTSEHNSSLQLANDMALYRQVVVNYFTANPGLKNMRVQATQLAATKPDWMEASTLTRWSNYIDDHDTIYVFAPLPLPLHIIADVVTVSRNSLLAGEARLAGGAQVLFAPAAASGSENGSPASGSALPAVAYIPTGSPVWLAHRN